MGRSMWSEETDITKKSGEIGEPCGVPNWTGENILGDPWKSSWQEHWDRKD